MNVCDNFSHLNITSNTVFVLHHELNCIVQQWQQNRDVAAVIKARNEGKAQELSSSNNPALLVAFYTVKIWKSIFSIRTKIAWRSFGTQANAFSTAGHGSDLSRPRCEKFPSFLQHEYCHYMNTVAMHIFLSEIGTIAGFRFWLDCLLCSEKNRH